MKFLHRIALFYIWAYLVCACKNGRRFKLSGGGKSLWMDLHIMSRNEGKYGRKRFYHFLRGRNCNFIPNKMSYTFIKKAITQRRHTKLSDVNEGVDSFLPLHEKKQEQKCEDGKILSSLFSNLWDKGKGGNSLLNDVRKLFKIVRESRNIFALGFMLTIISSVVDSYIPIYLSKTLSYIMSRSTTVIEKKNAPFFNSILIYARCLNPFYMYVFVSFLSLLFSSFRSYIFNICAYVSTNKLQNHLFRVLLHKSINYFKKKGRGELISRLNIDSSELIDIFTTNIIVLLRNLIKMILSFYFLYKINVHLFIVSLFIVIIISNISILFSNTFRRLAKEESNVVAYSNNIIEESVNNFSLINTFNMQEKEIEKFNQSLDNIYMSRIKLGLLYSVEKFLIRLIDMITLVVTLILSKQMIKHNINTDSRTIISSVMYMQNIISQSCTIEQQYSRVQELIGNAEDIIKLIEKDTPRNSHSKSASLKSYFPNIFHLIDIKNSLLNYSLLKKFRAIQKNADYIATVMRPNYLSLFERNYNNLSRFVKDSRSDSKDVIFCSSSGVKIGEVQKGNTTTSEVQNCDSTRGNFPNGNSLGASSTCDASTSDSFTSTPSAKWKDETQLRSTMLIDCGNTYEKMTNKIKKNKPELSIQEIHNYIKNEEDLIIKHKLDKKFIHFLKTKYKKNIISLIVKLYEERNNPIGDEFLFMLDNISTFKKVSVPDKKSILKMSHVTNNTLYIILLTFLFYNYSKFYHKKAKKMPINLLEKKQKQTDPNGSSSNGGSDCDISCGHEYGCSCNGTDFVPADDDVLNDASIGESSQSQDLQERTKYVTADDANSSNMPIVNPFPQETQEEFFRKMNNRRIKKKKKNLNNILPYIIQNAIKELEILKFIDKNYRNISENLMLDNVKDEKRGSTLIFENVDFYFAKYPKNKILSNINLYFSNIYTYGILCYNDSGRNDLSKLCTRLYNKTYGNILLDNENIENVSKYILTKKISLVEDETYLFSDSIIYNILYSYNCQMKPKRNSSHLDCTFRLNKSSLNNCVHLFSSDNEVAHENIKGYQKGNCQSWQNGQLLQGQMHHNEIQHGEIAAGGGDVLGVREKTWHPACGRTCLLCGSKVRVNPLEGQKRRKSYNKYKLHFIKKMYKEIMKVSKVVCLNDLVSTYKDKYFHNINEKILSGGQKQKISLARAIIKKPKVLILNEAFSALDSANEVKIFSNIKNYLPNCTIINLSHKITTISHCDYIYVLKDGKIIEQGLRMKLEENPNSEYAKKLSEF
ncbi:ABC transporter B family member 4, putative [Plasmodium ovale]|uniref:ABC transporter B family member 4, putative n=2 Tax=Plasmodium ovale TaxID=36330 RepID=A0A1A8VWM4_PLAOA|nr:ABC transporter B family member 4, putative [Plasmodium ovale curtisi]SCP04356.1 ABC transporter B family member 4, putative [Plasmodium ovale]